MNNQVTVIQATAFFKAKITFLAVLKDNSLTHLFKSYCIINYLTLTVIYGAPEKFLSFAGIDTDDLMAEGTTDSKGYFRVVGYTDEITNIDVKLNIYHDCDDGLTVRLENLS